MGKEEQMSTMELLAAEAAVAAEPPALPEVAVGHVLVGSDGSAAAEAALRVAAALSTERGAEIEVLTVLEPLPVYEGGYVPALPYGEIDEARERERSARVRKQLLALGEVDSDWPLELGRGRAAETLAARAVASGARLVVVGIGRHRPVDRLLGSETALQLVRRSPVPVLAVHPSAPALPRRVLVGTDFSASSGRALRVALSLMGAGGELDVVHVQPAVELPGEAERDWTVGYAREIDAQFARLLASLQLPRGVRVRTERVEGDPAAQLMAHAERMGADLVAVGSHGRSYLERLLVGSVATRVLRSSHTSVLVAPPEVAPAA